LAAMSAADRAAPWQRAARRRRTMVSVVRGAAETGAPKREARHSAAR